MTNAFSTVSIKKICDGVYELTDGFTEIKAIVASEEMRSYVRENFPIVHQNGLYKVFSFKNDLYWGQCFGLKSSVIGRISESAKKGWADAFVAIVDPYNRFEVADTMYMEHYFNNNNNFNDGYNKINSAGTHEILYKSNPDQELKVLSWIEGISNILTFFDYSVLLFDKRKMNEPIVKDRVDLIEDSKIYLIDSLGNEIYAPSNRNLYAQWIKVLSENLKFKNDFYKLKEKNYFVDNEIKGKANDRLTYQIDEDLHLKFGLDTDSIKRRITFFAKRYNIEVQFKLIEK